jgi:hypothetical protein
MTWQVPYRTRGSTGRRHVSGSFGILGVRLDQSRGDTCHHWKGDTWHGMTSAAYVADDVITVQLSDVSGTWTNRCLTRGIFQANGKVPHGPTSGCHVAPRHWFNIFQCKIWFMVWTGFEPRTSQC